MIGCAFVDIDKVVHIPQKMLMDEEVTRNDLQFYGFLEMAVQRGNCTFLQTIAGIKEANLTLLEEKGYISIREDQIWINTNV